MVKVSIIVPIYNVEKHLRRSIESIQHQTLEDIQIILVNDGSKDNSLAICRDYQVLDKRIIVIDQPNGGVSSARNTGLEVATGEYVGFVDPDDWIENNMYERLYEQAKEIDADICMCDYKIENGGSSIPVRMNIENDVLEGDEIVNKIIANMIGSPTLDSGSQTIMGSVWRIILKKEFIDNNKFTFNVGIPLMEDLLFCIDIFLKSKKVGINKGTFYHYVQHDNSAVTSYRKNMLELQLKVYEEIKKKLLRKNLYSLLKKRMGMRYVNMYLTTIVNEVRKDNIKKTIDKVSFISNLCKDATLKSILNEIDISGYKFRKRIVITAIKKEYSWFLYIYYKLILLMVGKH